MSAYRVGRTLLACFLLGPAVWNVESAHAELAKESHERPNILWITSEDNASHWLGCYGNSQAHTPRLDALARESVLFNHAYSNAPVCAVARSTILHGVYATSSGTQHMRSRHAIPAKLKAYVSYLRELGYYCTNNSKTDYNRAGSDTAIWDACSRVAHYKNRRKDQPFFAIFNLTVTHESSLFPEKVANQRRRGVIPSATRLSPEEIQLPPHLPDFPEIRQDFAIYHDNLTALDQQVGDLLDDLDKHDLAEETIVFYYSDHGGPTPRGKRYLTDTGVRVPMLVHVPKKWQHLSTFQAGQRTDELVTFVDLAPTLLSLAGIEKPNQMQGRAFLGTHRVEPAHDAMVFLYADRFDELYGMRRGLTDGRYKYIRRFTPHLPAAPCSDYSFSMPSWVAWRKAWQEGKLSPEHRALWESPQPVEELYDLEADPWEVHNLANETEHANRLGGFRQRLVEQMAGTRDTGVIPEPLFDQLANDATIHQFVRGESFDFNRALRAAFTASSGDPTHLPKLAAMLENTDAVIRYWGTLGCAILGKQAKQLRPNLETLTLDPYSCIRVMAADALGRMDQSHLARSTLVKEFDQDLTREDAMLLLNVATHLQCQDVVPRAWIEQQLTQGKRAEHVRRFAKYLKTDSE